MEDMSLIPIVVAALIPTIVGFLYYNPKTVGGHWMQALGKTEEELQEGFNMPVVMIISLLLSFVLAFGINAMVEIGHMHIEEGTPHHTFKHGALHGVIYAVLFIVPVMITNGLYERKSWKLMWINLGYWFITFALIGGLTDAWN